MIGILICGHGHFARGLIEAAEMLCGPQAYLQALDYELNEDIDVYRRNLLAQIETWEPQTEEILCLCDMLGGFPMEACLTELPFKKVKIFTETTLTLLTYLLVCRNGSQDSHQMIDNAVREAREAIYVIDPQILFADQEGEAS